MMIIIIITLIRKFLKRVDNLKSSAGIVASFLEPYRRQANRSLKCYIYAEYHECINEKYLNIKITVSSFLYSLPHSIGVLVLKNDIEVVK